MVCLLTLIKLKLHSFMKTVSAAAARDVCLLAHARRSTFFEVSNHLICNDFLQFQTITLYPSSVVCWVDGIGG